METSLRIPQAQLIQLLEILEAFGGEFAAPPDCFKNLNTGELLATVAIRFEDSNKYYAFRAAWQNMDAPSKTKKSWWQFWKPKCEVYYDQ
jgi:hypothetical protein